MFDKTPSSTIQNKVLADLSDLELAQALSERLAIANQDWHRLKGNRKAQAGQQIASALVFLLKDSQPEALGHLTQAVGWLDRSVKAPSCPDKERMKQQKLTT